MNPKGAASQNFQLPKRVRLNNLFDRLFKQKELLTLDGILDSVRKRSELTDWGDPGFLEALQAQVHSYNTETDATPFSHGAFKRSCVSKIMLRCQLVDWWKRHPEILEQPVQRPIFVTGMPRTGTTFLHRLLSQDPNNRPLLYWEQQWPTPPPQPETYQTDERIKWAKRSRDGLFTLAPELEAIHPMEAQGPEECNGLFDPEFANMATAGLNHMPSFVEWILKRDMTQTYKFYRGELQLLNWKMPPKRWCLKSPSHLYFLDALLAVFPDASIIWNHRPRKKPWHRDPVWCISTGKLARDEPSRASVVKWPTVCFGPLSGPWKQEKQPIPRGFLTCPTGNWWKIPLAWFTVFTNISATTILQNLRLPCTVGSRQTDSTNTGYTVTI